MINIEEKYLKTLKNILKKYPYKFYAFGSRVKGDNRKYSDLDICYKENIPTNVLLDIRDELENSDLPFRVDLVFWNNFSSGYKKLITSYLTPIL